jgi:uncharacterized protein (TIGR00251 family)
VTDLAIQEREGAVTFTVRVQPRASRSELAGVHGDALKVRLAAPPVDGEANEECVRLLSRVLGVGRASVTIVTGHASKTKVVRVHGLAARELRTRLGIDNELVGGR